jgi:hypothetical protein
MKEITLEMLRENGACSFALKEFMRLFPDGSCAATAENGWKISYGFAEWVEMNLFNQAQRDEYARRTVAGLSTTVMPPKHGFSAGPGCPGCRYKADLVAEIYNRGSGEENGDKTETAVGERGEQA